MQFMFSIIYVYCLPLSYDTLFSSNFCALHSVWIFAAALYTDLVILFDQLQAEKKLDMDLSYSMIFNGNLSNIISLKKQKKNKQKKQSKQQNHKEKQKIKNKNRSEKKEERNSHKSKEAKKKNPTKTNKNEQFLKAITIK